MSLTPAVEVKASAPATAFHPGVQRLSASAPSPLPVFEKASSMPERLFNLIRRLFVS